MLSHKRSFRENLVKNITKLIENEEFASRSKVDLSGFTRKRKIPFKDLLVLIMKGLKRSLQRELNSFYKEVNKADFSIVHVTKGAFSQSRSKLKPEAFVELSQSVIKDFYRDAPYYMWHYHRLLAIDGSKLMLPNHPSIEEEFGKTGYGSKADSFRSMGQVSMLYDVLNYITLDATLAPLSIGERELCRGHFAQMQEDDLVLLDRGYPSLGLFFEMIARKVHFCARMTDNWWLEVKQMLDEGETDKIVSFQLPVKFHNLLGEYNISATEIKCRLLKVSLPNEETMVLCTSLLDKEKYPHEHFADLYHLRWNEEEGYKLYKSRCHLEAFSGKTSIAVKQDFYANVFTMNLCAALAHPIEEKLKKEAKEQNRKHDYKINRTNAIGYIKESLVGIFIKKKYKKAIAAFDQVLEKTPEIVRTNRSFLRKHIKKKPPSMNYKQL